jgi:ATP-dependent RNA helicase DDX20
VQFATAQYCPDSEFGSTTTTPVFMSSTRGSTWDVRTTDGVDFKELLLSATVERGLTSAGYLKPSPIQLRAIPLGRFGVDLIAQAKSGTGKTCVFSVILLENIDTSVNVPQAMVLAPTREIAVQICNVIRTIGKYVNGLKCAMFIGGLAVRNDRAQLQRGCHIVVGSPGRVKQLIELGILKVNSIRMAVLDEADQLLEGTFRGQVSWILAKLPTRKQTMIFSATFAEKSLETITKHMRNPQRIMLSRDEPSLRGVKQYYAMVSTKAHRHATTGMVTTAFHRKIDILCSILKTLPFHQCVVFTNQRAEATELVSVLENHGWPTVSIAGELSQVERLDAMKKVYDFKVRVLVSTDLTARGVDIERITLVIHMDLPMHAETYMHRVGRTGRFGSYGVSVALITGQTARQLRRIAERYNTDMELLEDVRNIPAESLGLTGASPESNAVDTAPPADGKEVVTIRTANIKVLPATHRRQDNNTNSDKKSNNVQVTSATAAPVAASISSSHSLTPQPASSPHLGAQWFPKRMPDPLDMRAHALRTAREFLEQRQSYTIKR